MNLDWQVHPVWRRRRRSLGGEHELSHGWQQAPHSCKWRTDPVTELLCTALWGVPEACPKLALSRSSFQCAISKISSPSQVGDLHHASPATVSRCGMVFVDPKNLRYIPYWQRWVTNGHSKVSLNKKCNLYSSNWIGLWHVQIFFF